MKTEVDLDEIIRVMQLPYTVAPLQYFDAMEGYREGRYGLFYDVGGGKTLVSTLIALLHALPVVAAMPHILIRQWERWLKKVRIPESEIYVYYGTKRDSKKLKTAKWVLTSHAIFRKDSEVFQAAYKGRRVTLLLDEAQAIKDYRTKLFKAVIQFVGADNPFVAMTATATSKPEDTYAYMKVKTPGLYRNFTHWDSLHVKSRNIFKAVESYKNLELLRDNFAIRAAKRDKKELFGYSDDMRPILDPIRYELSPAHNKLYRKLVEEQLLLLPDGQKIDGTTAQRLRHMLQQIVWNPARFSGNPDDVAAGFELLEQICEETNFMPPEKGAFTGDQVDKPRTKLVVWTYYRSTSEAIFKWMTEKYGNVGVLAYGGGDAQKAVDSIMFDETTRFMVANPLSVGAGLELQHVCWEMFFAELITTPIPNRQALGRFDRPGQKTRPTARFGQAIGTVQESLFKDLLRNDEQATFIERTRTSLRDELLGIC